MRVQVLFGGDVTQADAHLVGDIVEWVVDVVVLLFTGRVEQEPVVVRVAVRVECDLLFWKAISARG